MNKTAWIITAAVAGLGAALAQQISSDLIAKAKAEGTLVSYGSPDDWAGYGELNKLITSRYGIGRKDTDMGSAEEIAKFDAEKNAPVASIGDIGLQFGPIGASKGVLLAYKHSKWNDIPAWAKDPDGQFSASYLGAVAIVTNTKLVKNVPRSFKDLLKPEYKGQIAINDPRKSANAQFAIIAAAFANGGSEKNIQPGIDFFAKLQKSGNLKPVLPSLETVDKGEVPIMVNWDFIGVQWKKLAKSATLESHIPSDGSTYGAYATVINKYAPQPNAAKLFVEMVHSDEGQIAFARAGARPIRSNVKLPADVSASLLPEDEYKVVKPITDWTIMDDLAKQIGQKWATEVLGQ